MKWIFLIIGFAAYTVIIFLLGKGFGNQEIVDEINKQRIKEQLQ